MGINASLVPGVRAGPDSFVGPHVCLRQDPGANKRALLESRYEVEDNKPNELNKLKELKELKQPNKPNELNKLKELNEPNEPGRCEVKKG